MAMSIDSFRSGLNLNRLPMVVVRSFVILDKEKVEALIMLFKLKVTAGQIVAT
jgi:hypothetical protein